MTYCVIIINHVDKRGKTKNEGGSSSLGAASEAETGAVLGGARITQYLHEEVSKEKIELLSGKNMTEALFEFVDKMENDSVST